MEILDMKFAGIPVWMLIVGVGLWYGVRNAWREWREQRAMVREMEEAQSKFNAEHEWKPYLVNGIDCGEWVRKDGEPIRD
jgi:hypothetical protein